LKGVEGEGEGKGDPKLSLVQHLKQQWTDYKKQNQELTSEKQMGSTTIIFLPSREKIRRETLGERERD